VGSVKEITQEPQDSIPQPLDEKRMRGEVERKRGVHGLTEGIKERKRSEAREENGSIGRQNKGTLCL
jgi:hypothetical protein